MTRLHKGGGKNGNLNAFTHNYKLTMNLVQASLHLLHHLVRISDPFLIFIFYFYFLEVNSPTNDNS